MLSSFRIGDKLVGKKQTFIIAEIGMNHNNEMNTATMLIDDAIKAGVDAVKFQFLKPITEENKRWYRSSIIDYCEEKGILWTASTNDIEGIKFLEKNGVKFHKIASPQCALRKDLVEEIAKTGKPIIMSTGYCNDATVRNRYELIEKHNDKLAILYCISEYPPRPETLNLSCIPYWSRLFNVPIGFSDHTVGWQATLASIALGATVVEKHITLDRLQEGPDHSFATEMEELKAMVEDIRIVEKVFGHPGKIITVKEMSNLREIREKV